MPVMRKLAFFLLLSFFCFPCFGQEGAQEENTEQPEVAPAKMSYLRLFVENDFLQLRTRRTDNFYTNGIRIEYLTSSKEVKLLDLLLLGLPADNTSSLFYGISLSQNMYTPSDIKVSDLMVNDRPYGGWMYASLSRISTDRIEERRLKSELSLGVIGSISFAEETQKIIHELINSPEPMGWDHQIKNDVGVNYHLAYEGHLLRNKNADIWELVGILRGNAGTVFTNGGAGLLFRAAVKGKLNPYFSEDFDLGTIPVKAANQKAFSGIRSFLFARPIGNLVAYNAMLQGGVFNRESEYLVGNKDIRRFVFDLDYGVVFIAPGLNSSLVIGQAIRTKEFLIGQTHRWGYLTLSIGWR